MSYTMLYVGIYHMYVNNLNNDIKLILIFPYFFSWPFLMRTFLPIAGKIISYFKIYQLRNITSVFTKKRMYFFFFLIIICIYSTDVMHKVLTDI